VSSAGDARTAPSPDPPNTHRSVPTEVLEVIAASATYEAHHERSVSGGTPMNAVSLKSSEPKKTRLQARHSRDQPAGEHDAAEEKSAPRNRVKWQAAARARHGRHTRSSTARCAEVFTGNRRQAAHVATVCPRAGTRCEPRPASCCRNRSLVNGTPKPRPSGRFVSPGGSAAETATQDDQKIALGPHAKHQGRSR